MLTLTRKKNESIDFKVGEISFSLSVVEVRGKQVRLGIEAPAEVIVARSEISGRDPQPPTCPHCKSSDDVRICDDWVTLSVHGPVQMYQLQCGMCESCGPRGVDRSEAIAAWSKP